MELVYFMSAQQFISESCSWFHRQDNYVQALLMQTLSGIGLNRMGLYQQCISNDTLKYFLMQYTLIDTSQTFYSGICYSSNCTAPDLMYITRSLNQYIPLPFTNYKIYQPSFDQQADKSGVYFWNGYMIAIWTIFAAVLALTIVSTVMDLVSRPSKQKHKRLVSIMSIKSSFMFIFNRSKSIERINVIAGLRAFSFLGMTLYNIAFLLTTSPSLPQPSQISTGVQSIYFCFDVWLMIAGFYYSFQLCKNWSKSQNMKILFYIVMRKVIKIVSLSALVIILTNAIVYGLSGNPDNSSNGPLWFLTWSYFKNKCHFASIFSQCNYWLWIWSVQLQMCFIASLLFILWQLQFKYHKFVYIGLNFIIIGLGFVIAPIWGVQDNGPVSYRLQGPIVGCSIVTGPGYLIGFNLGLLYFTFRTHRNKSQLLIIRIIKYKINRLLSTIIALCILTLVQLYFLYLHDSMPVAGYQSMLQLFHVIVPLCFTLLLLPEMLGFESLWGALFKDKFMNVASKLSFSSYTIYYLICIVLVNALGQDLYVNASKLIIIWVMSLAIALPLGFCMCGLIEVPIYRGLHLAFGRSYPKAYVQFY